MSLSNLAMKIEDMGLSIRTELSLRKLDVKTLGDLVKTDVRVLAKSLQFGRRSLLEVLEEMKKLGVEMRGMNAYHRSLLRRPKRLNVLVPRSLWRKLEEFQASEEVMRGARPSKSALVLEMMKDKFS